MTEHSGNLTDDAPRWRPSRVGSPRVSVLWALMAALAACAPAPRDGFRDLSVPITATTRYTPEGFAGQWHVIAAYPTDLMPTCAAQSWQAGSADVPPRLVVSCGDAVQFEAPLVVDPRGVMRIERRGLDRDARALWVMWMAEDRRAAVIGTPSGEMGWIVNRTPRLPPDRLTAARAIMAFNGYDVTRLLVGPK